jgi:hypothetical protein
LTLAHLSTRTLRNSITCIIHMILIRKRHIEIRVKTLKKRMRRKMKRTVWSQVRKV